MTLDGGYLGSLDHALANLHVGRSQGLAEGIQEGRALGHDEGYQAGFTEGWERAAAEGNRLLSEQSLGIRALEQDVAELRKLIARHARSNEALAVRACQSEDHRRQTTAQLRETLWRYNTVVVCMNVMRTVLLDIFSQEGDAADVARNEFVRIYRANINKALANGTIRLPPHEDDAFRKAFPNTVQLIVEQLRS